MLWLVSPVGFRVPYRDSEPGLTRLNDDKVNDAPRGERADRPLKRGLQEHARALRAAPEFFYRGSDVPIGEVDQRVTCVFEFPRDPLLVPCISRADRQPRVGPQTRPASGRRATSVSIAQRIPSNSFAGAMPSAFASRTIVLRRGSRSPRSSNEI